MVGSLVFSTIDLLPAFWMLENQQKPSPSTPLWSNVTSQILQFQGVHHRACILHKPLPAWPKFHWPATTNSNHSNKKQKWSLLFRWLPGNCEPQTPKASFPSPLSSSVVSPPRAFFVAKEGMEPWRVIWGSVVQVPEPKYSEIQWITCQAARR